MPHHPFPAKSHHVHHTLHLFVNMPLNKVSAAFRHPHSCAFALEYTRLTRSLLKCFAPCPLVHVSFTYQSEETVSARVSNICFSFPPTPPSCQQRLDRKHSFARAGREGRVRKKQKNGGGEQIRRRPRKFLTQIFPLSTLNHLFQQFERECINTDGLSLNLNFLEVDFC